jgi:hypothetical protein
MRAVTWNGIPGQFGRVRLDMGETFNVVRGDSMAGAA